MPSKNPAQRLSDIIDNVDAIHAFTTGLDFQAFHTDKKTVYAVVRTGDHLGSVAALPEEMLLRHPEIDWPAIAAAGNVYRHEYEAVDETLIGTRSNMVWRP